MYAPPRMSGRGRTLLWAMLGAGAVLRIVLAFETYGVRYDIDSQAIAADALGGDLLHLYSEANGGPTNRWPYLPGFLPLIAAADGVASATGAAFHAVVQFPEIAADLAIAWLVQDLLGRRGMGERVRLVAAALVALGPSFWMVSGYHGQIDSAAILPAVAALWVWERSPPGPRRAVVAGLLVGLGATIKFVPIVMLVALLPSSESARERLALVTAALALPVVSIAPFLAADWDGVTSTFRSHRELPGMGGLSLVVQPELAESWLRTDRASLSGVSRWLLDNQGPVTGALMAPFVALAFLRRLPAWTAAALLFAALLVFGGGFAYQYVVWSLPFALVAGWLWQAAAVQAALLVPAAMMYWHPFDWESAPLYSTIMIALWVVVAAALVRLAVRLARTPRAPRREVAGAAAAVGAGGPP